MKSLGVSQPHAIIVVGVPGSGKTQFAEKFARTFGAPYIQMERILAQSQDSDAARAILDIQLTELIKTKASLILDTDTNDRTEREQLVRYLQKQGYTPLLVWVQTEPVAAEYRSRKKYTATEYRRLVDAFVLPHEKEQPVVISGKHTYTTQARAVLKRIIGHDTSPRQTPRSIPVLASPGDIHRK